MKTQVPSTKCSFSRLCYSHDKYKSRDSSTYKINGAPSMPPFKSVEGLADYWKCFRAKNMVNDMKFTRVRLVSDASPWTVLGQSYDGVTMFGKHFEDMLGEVDRKEVIDMKRLKGKRFFAPKRLKGKRFFAPHLLDVLPLKAFLAPFDRGRPWDDGWVFIEEVSYILLVEIILEKLNTLAQEEAGPSQGKVGVAVDTESPAVRLANGVTCPNSEAVEAVLQTNQAAWQTNEALDTAPVTHEFQGMHCQERNRQKVRCLHLKSTKGRDFQFYELDVFTEKCGTTRDHLPAEYAVIQVTDNFSDSNKLGIGRFGTEYKGVFLDGKTVAVKRLSRKSWQGLEEFKNGIIVIAKCQHKNLVKLLGCAIPSHEKLLVYEFMPNRSLDLFIFNSKKV
ncbi:hypothetical protein F2P56_035135 [Juglans regia]|uniref:Protein kinase domain-containing protein n=1 Tax=Juglans regia TaxID=51240 RepID=A0A833TMK0_JUGRE|nr:hypothetical protein F2P56_035135 [Juglans regia]